MTDPNDFWGRGSGAGKPSDGAEGSGLRPQGPQEPGAGFYAKQTSSEPAPAQEPDFWGKAEKARERERAEREALLKDPGVFKRRRRRTLRRVLIGGGVAVVVLVIGLVVFAPQIGSSLAPGIIRDEAGKAIAGSVDIGEVDLSWGGPQQIRGVRLTGTDGKEVFRGNVESSAGLLGLAFGSLDLGTVTLSAGKLAVVREADGTTNLERAIAPPGKAAPAKPRTPAKGSPAQPASLPEGLRVRVLVQGLDATFTDRSASGAPRTAAVRDLDVKATVAPGEALVIEATGEAFEGDAATARKGEGGALAISARIADWSRPDGRVTLDRASGKGDVSLTGVPLAIVDALVPPLVFDEQGAPIALASALGPRADVEAQAQLDADKGGTGTGTFRVSTQGASAGGDIAIENGIVRVVKPIRVAAQGAAVRTLVPAIDASLRAGGSSVEALPNIALVLEKLAMPLPSGPGLPSLKGLALDASVEITEFRGGVEIEKGAGPKPFRVAPLSVRVTTDDLGAGVRLTAKTQATLDDQPAGEIDADLRASGLLDATGRPIAGLPPVLDGRVRITGVATPIAQPFVQSTGIELTQDVGPTLDIEVVAGAGAKPAGAAAADVPPATLALRVSGQHLTMTGDVQLTNAGLTTTGEGVTIRAARAGAVAARMVGADTGWALAAPEGGGATVRVTGLSVPRDLQTGAFKKDQVTADATVELGALAARRTIDEPSAAVQLSSTKVGVALRPGASAKVTLDAQAADSGAPFRIVGTLDAKNLYTVDASGAIVPTPPMTIRPTGKIEITGLPASLARLAPPPAEGGLDVRALVRELLGGPADVTVAFTNVPDNARAVDATLTAKSPRLSAEFGGVVDNSRAALRAGTLGATVSPGIVTTLLQQFAPGVGGNPSLAGPARLSLKVDPLELPLTPAGAPDLSRTPTAGVRISLAGQTLVDGLGVANADGTTRDLGRLGLEDFVVTARVPVAAMVAPPLSGQRTLQVNASGVVLSANATPMIRLDADLSAEVAEGKPDGAIAARVGLSGMNTWDVERLMGQPGMLTGLLGPFADLAATVNIAPPAGGYPATDPFAAALITGELGLKSERLVSERPIAFRVGPDRIELTQPAGLRLTPDVAALNEMLRAGKPPEQAAASIAEMQTVSLEIRTLSIPRGVRSVAMTGPAAPAPGGAAPAEIGASLSAPRIVMLTPDAQFTRLSGTRLNIVTEEPVREGNAGQAVAFRLDIDEAGVGDTPTAKGANLAGRVDSLFAPDAMIDLAAATLTMRGDVPAAPTAIVDALMDQDGTMTEALGPVVSLRVNVSGMPLIPPKPGPDGKYPSTASVPVIDLEATSNRARATMRGTVKDGLYVSERPLEISVTEITKELLREHVRLLPLLGSVEKTSQDVPAMFTATDMTVPLDGNLSRLNASINITPGECRFDTSRGFASLLKVVDQRTSGTLGQRLPPLSISIRQGVATYPKWKLPLGEFSVETSGVVNLTDAPVTARSADGREVQLAPRSLDVITWIPAGALTDQALGLFNVGAGTVISKLTPGLLDPFTTIPFRTRGPMDNPETGPAADLFGEQIKNSFDPRRLLDLIRPK
ncbi:MAG: hypothetical protein SFZ24_07475 [Planctomycetota bacterium]|nr:hypothetical protein [Planctomycetota bacterium]